ncbi:uncharacterized protein [Panulirus ornatus]
MMFAGKEMKSYTPQLHPTDNTHILHNAQKLQRSEIQDNNHLSLVSDQHVNHTEEHIIKNVRDEHHQDQFIKRLPPQQPTTKETEAANVLMNLSGKAADRASHARLDPCLPHQEFTVSDVGKPSLYILPSGTSNSKYDSPVKREYPVCDEVPQINEKDLLPLATQVLCQFCSRQCEDLVELHEHVLAMHNVPETDPPLMPSYKKLKNHLENEDELKYCDGKRWKQDFGDHVRECSKDSPLTSLSTASVSQESNNKQYIEEKRLKRKPKLKRGGKEVSNWNNNKEQSDHHHYKEENINKNKNFIKEYQTVSQEPKENTLRSQLDTYDPHEQFHQENHNTAVKTDGLCDKDEDWLKCHTAESITELTPVGSDALAIAIESSQIRVIEAKVTIFVCLKCSSGYTDSQEFRGHICSSSCPFVQNFADGSVMLASDTSMCEDRIQLPDNNVWYFPEFFIRRPLEDEKNDGLQIIHSSSGRKLQLHTNYQPAYLSEQLISFRCPTCENDCDSLGRFLEHLIKGPCMFRCPECSLVYITQDKLQKHRASLHPTLEDRTCPNCHAVFEKRHQRNKHLKTKCSQRHICVMCGGVLKNEYNLRVHMQSHEERNHICSECGAAFHRRAILKRHMMRHSGTKPHACSQCEARFYTRQHLKTHMDRHNRFRRFPCSSCNKAYYSKHDRDTHYSKVHCKTISGQKSLTTHEQKFVNEHLIE